MNIFFLIPTINGRAFYGAKAVPLGPEVAVMAEIEKRE
jgi:hypothetical protein